MTWTSERLPIVLPPQPGEALDSWITAYARRLHTTGPELLKHMGINQVLSTLVSQPPTTELDVIAQRAGVPSELVHSMTLDSHISPARFPFLPSNAWTPTAPWRPLRDGSRYCPDCLEEHGGRWPLAWRLPWTFSCREHGCLLIDSCPKCHGRPHASAPRASHVHGPGHCTRRIHVGRTMPSCGHPLALAATTALPRDGAVLEAQQHVTALLEQLPEHESAALGSQLHDIYVLGWRSLRALSVGGPTPDIVQAVLSECGHSPDVSLRALPSTDKLAVGTTLGALSTNSQTGAEILTWMVRADHGSPGQRLRQWRNTSSPLFARVLADADSELPLQRRLSYRSATRQPARPDLDESGVRQRARSVPSLLWPGWSLRLLPTAALDPRTRDDYRRTCAAMLLLPGAQVGFLKAARMLELDARLPTRAAFPKLVTGPQHATVIASCLGQLATRLDLNGSPIDYARRRALFTSDTLILDLDAYTRLCRREGWSRGGDSRVQHLRWALLSLLLGAHADLPDGMRLHDRDEFRFKIPALMRTFLVDQATDNLERHKIHEPVLWEPPSDWCEELAWPGSTPDSISHAGFPAMAAAGTCPDDIARILRLTPEHLRLYCDATGITAPLSSPKEPGLGRRTPRRGLLAPEALRAAHRTGGINQSRIARQIGCSPSTVQNALNEAGIRRSRRPEPLNAHITREQLEHAYLHQRRSLPDIAEELGVDKDRLTLLAKKWGIPIRPNSTTTNPFALLPNAPPLSEPMAAISNVRNCVERLKRLVQLPGHRNLCTAAKHLGTLPATLTHQLNALEKAAGLQLIQRTNPLMATVAGTALIREAEHLLNLLDKARSLPT